MKARERYEKRDTRSEIRDTRSEIREAGGERRASVFTLRSSVLGPWSLVLSRRSPVPGLRSPVFAVIALLALCGPALAEFNNPTLLTGTPTADVLPAGSFAISGDLTWPFGRTPSNYPETEFNAGLRFSPVRRLDISLTAYTLQDYVLGASWQIVGGGPGRFAWR
jgi:hypothetical protein